MKRLFLLYAALIVGVQPIIWCLAFGCTQSICNAILLHIGSPRPFDTPIRVVSLWMAAGSPLLIWPVAGAFFSADLFRWRFGTLRP